MATNNQTSKLDFSYLAVVLLLAYVMTSGPKYLKKFRETHEDIKIEINPFQQVLKIGKAYTLDHYLRAFNAVKSINLASSSVEKPTLAVK